MNGPWTVFLLGQEVGSPVHSLREQCPTLLWPGNLFLAPFFSNGSTSLSKKNQVSWELGWLKQQCHSQCANEFLKLPSEMRLRGGVGSVPFYLFLKKKKNGLSFCEWVYTHTYTRPLTQKKLSLSNCPKLLKVIFPSLRSQNVQVLDWFLFLPFWNPIPFLKTQLLLVISLAWHCFCLTC